MGKLWFLLYNTIAVPLQYIFYLCARLGNRKIAEGMAGRKGQKERIKQALEAVDKNRKRIVFHCVSVGEWEQALPLIKKLKNGNSDIYVIVTFFSPSGFNFVKNSSDIDLKIYLPFDGYFRAKNFLKTIRPDLWIIVKHDIWPNHVYAARALSIPVILVDATLPPKSFRNTPVLRSFFRSVYNSFTYMFPISAGDRDRYLKLYPFPNKMTVTGDTRFDQVVHRGQDALKSKEIRLFDTDDTDILIAGSTWPSDEKHLLPAVRKLLKKFQSLSIILVPHEPKERYLRGIESELQQVNVSSKRYSTILKSGVNGTRVAIIDSVGLLVTLYSKADIAYVGGSFGPGVHNVMEPGILGKPVLFGPNHLNSFEAIELINCGGGFAVKNSSEITDRVSNFLNNSDKRFDAGNKARQLIQNNLGAADNIIKQLRDMYDFIPEDNSD